MSPRDWQSRIQDILDAIKEIQLFIVDFDFALFKHDARTIRAVELNFIIIGEAVMGIPEGFQESHPEIPWHFMRAMRNRLVHVYFQVDPQLVWETVVNDLPQLYAALEKLLS